MLPYVQHPVAPPWSYFICTETSIPLAAKPECHCVGYPSEQSIEPDFGEDRLLDNPRQTSRYDHAFTDTVDLRRSH